VAPVLQAAARAPVAPLPLPAQEQDGVQETPSKKAKKAAKKAGAGGESGADAPAGAQQGRHLDLAVLLLEVLQWKAVEGGKA